VRGRSHRGQAHPRRRRGSLRAVGLDVGSRTIGVAVSDELGLLAHPRKTLARKGTKGDVATVRALVAAEEATRVIVGLPFTLDGKIGPRAQRVQVFIDALRDGWEVPVEPWDERYSTIEAARGLDEAGVYGDRRREVIDAAAAAVILQGWLDARRT
jgi:putative holliday junction resolvase